MTARRGGAARIPTRRWRPVRRTSGGVAGRLSTRCAAPSDGASPTPPAPPPTPSTLLALRRYKYRLTTGDWAKVEVRRHDDVFAVRVVVAAGGKALPPPAPVVVKWGLYREVLDEIVPPERLPPGSRLLDDALVCTELSAGARQFDFTVDVDQAPCALAMTVFAGDEALGPTSDGVGPLRSAIGYLPGRALPLGLSAQRGLLNFAVASAHATEVSLVLEADGEELLELALDPALHRTGDVWHVALPADQLFEGDLHGLSYRLRCNGPLGRTKGSRFQPLSLVADPYAAAVTVRRSGEVGRGGAVLEGDISAATEAFDWTGDVRPRWPTKEAVLYHLHPHAFTAHPSCPVSDPALRGTFKGVEENLPYLETLGVNTVVLDPVAAFVDLPDSPDYLGRASASLMAPHPGFATTPGAAPRELKSLVRALHSRGMAAVVGLHLAYAAEGTDDAPRPLSFRGVDAASYFRVAADPPGALVPHSTGDGCVFDFSSPPMRAALLDALRHWVSEYRVDGLYLHGVSALMQGRAGEPQLIPPLLEALVNDPVLSGVALYAADVHPLEMGRLPHWGALVERNVLFRDDVRRFLSGGGSGSSTVAAFGARLCGSGDCFAPARTPQASLNVISGPDGRSAADALLPAAAAASTADGEARVLCPRDGAFMPVDGSRGFNTAAPASTLPVEHRQMRNLLTALFVSQGLPMLSMGDEYGLTRGGAPCAPNVASNNLFRWDAYADTAQGRAATSLYGFTAALVSLRRRRPELLAQGEYVGKGTLRWLGRFLSEPNWADPHERVVAFMLRPKGASEGLGGGLYVAFNASAQPASVTLPAPPAGAPEWLRIVDSSVLPPADAMEFIVPHATKTYTLPPHSSVVLEARVPRV